jgi:glycyl-tRNA synthetase beta chain
VHAAENVDPARFETPQERELYSRYQEIEGRVAGAIKAGDYEGVLAELAQLRPPVNAFFEQCMVMAEDQGVRANRLALLGVIAALFSQVADFSRMGTGEAEAAGAEGGLLASDPLVKGGPLASDPLVKG